MSRPTFARGLLLLCLVAACDRAEPPADRAQREPGDSARPDTVSEPLVSVPTIYGTHFLFLSTEGSTPLALALHVIGKVEPQRYVRDHRGWLLRGTDWAAVGWDRIEEPPTRRPWRIFPASHLRVIVGEQGDITELIAAAPDARVSLRPGSVLDRWEDADAARRQIRQGTLNVGGAPVSGIVLQEQVARPRASIPPPFRGHEAFALRLGSGDLLLVGQPRDAEGYGKSFAWASLGGVQRRWDRVEVQAAERMNDTTLGRVVPVRWRFTIPEPGIQGELAADGSRASPFSDSPGSPLHLVVRVTGWVEADGRRRDVLGLLEHGAP